MSEPNRIAFISFDYEISEVERVQFCEELVGGSLSFRVENWSTMARGSREDWNKLVHSQIGRCDFMIVLVAEGMDRRRAEGDIIEARRCNVPFFGVYAGNAKVGTALPDGLGANRTVAWDWERIAAAVQQVCTEGKHHVFR